MISNLIYFYSHIVKEGDANADMEVQQEIAEE